MACSNAALNKRSILSSARRRENATLRFGDSKRIIIGSLSSIRGQSVRSYEQLKINESRKENRQTPAPWQLSGASSASCGEPFALEEEAASPAEDVFEVLALRKHFDDGQVQALRGVDLRVTQGEFVAITGPSGCGKTTLLQMLGALNRPTAGTLLYRGNSIPDLPDPSVYRAQEIGFIFQSFHLLPTFTALENVQIPMFESELPISERRARGIALLKSVGLEHRLHHFPAKLSGGERQRVGIARSLANSPSVLLADEPTGSLDSENAHLVLDLIVRVHQEQNMTLVLVTHDVSIAQRASRTIQMKDGHVVSDRQTTLSGKYI